MSQGVDVCFHEGEDRWVWGWGVYRYRGGVWLLLGGCREGGKQCVRPKLAAASRRS